MKKVSIYWLILLVFLASCGGSDDSPGPTQPTNPPVLISPYRDCVSNSTSNTLELVTWNIKNFPQNGETTLTEVEDIIEELDPDVIALQEIASIPDFEALVASLENWEGHVEHVSGSSQRLGYLYKTTEITVLEAPSNLFAEATSENNSAFTSVRRPLHMKIRHTNGMEVDLINIHLKCCDGSEGRRRLASELLKDYIDTNLPTDEVVLLGDFNDEIVDEDNVFQNFLDDTANFRFTTLTIAQGPSSGWSFPSWPSQIDQILISDELLENEVSTAVLQLDDCVSTFPNNVSDHRPVLISFETF